MKQGKNPTRAQKEVITANRLNAKNWLVLLDGNRYLKVQNKISGKERILEKPILTGRKDRRR